MSAPAEVETSGLTKRFGRITAVDGIDLRIRRGDLYGLVGQNGAGKTTTLRMLTGLIRPTAGTITFRGAPTRHVGPKERRRLSALIDSPSFFGRLSGLDNVLGLAGLSPPVSRTRARELMSPCGLRDAADRPASTYSLGMKQRLA